MNNIKHNLDILDKNRGSMALGIISDPGLSKSSQIHQWAEEHGRNVTELIISQRMPSEISGMPMPISETQKMEIFDFETLLKMNDGDILFFDEFTNGNIQTLNACLTLIQERRMLSGKKLPDVMIVAAGNPQGSCDLLPQTKQRFLWTKVSFCQYMWMSYMWKKHRVMPNSNMVDLVKRTYNTSMFNNRDEYNYLTARTADNLMTIANQIEYNDTFWRSAEIPASIIDALYGSINAMLLENESKSIYDDLLDSLVLFADRFSEEKSVSACDLSNIFVTAVDNVKTTGDLKRRIRNIEASVNPTSMAFVRFIKMDRKSQETISWESLNSGNVSAPKVRWEDETVKEDVIVF